MRILLVDDHALVRKGLRRILEAEIGGASLGEAADVDEALDLVRHAVWDVVLLDLSMPDRRGLEAVKDLHKLRPGIPVLILTMHEEDQYALRAFRAGAAGYLTKAVAPSELVDAVHRVAAGRKYITPRIAEALANSLGGGAGADHDSLSDRELQVLRLLGNGRTLTEIGADLTLSVKTVSTYRTRILDKMALRNTAQLVRYVVGSGLVD
jgi:two-component system, NarL family, invasion response regulator UvrY